MPADLPAATDFHPDADRIDLSMTAAEIRKLPPLPVVPVRPGDQGRELVGVVMDPAGLFNDDVILQVRFLERGDDLVLFARLTEQDLERLQPFRPAG